MMDMSLLSAIRNTRYSSILHVVSDIIEQWICEYAHNVLYIGYDSLV